MQNEAAGLGHRVITALSWSYLGVAGHVLLQIIANIAFARLLGPDQFGLFSGGLLITGILKVVCDLGYGSAISQAQRISTQDTRHLFTRLMGAGVAAFFLLELLSGPLADFLKDNRLTWVFRSFAFSLLIFPFATVTVGLLARDLNQKLAHVANVVGYGVGYFGIGVAAAAFGWGAWSPILGFFAQLLIATSLLLVFARPDLRPLFSADESSRELTRFGSRVMMTNISNWLIYAMDNLLVQRLFGTRQFGAYSLAYGVVRTPVDHLVQNIQSVLLPAASKMKEDVDRMSLSYIAAIDAILLVTLPVFGTIAVIAGTFVEAIYGAQWSDADSVVAPLSLAMPMQAVASVSSTILWGKGAVGRDLRVQQLVAVALLLTILLCARISFQAVAWGVFAVYSLRALLLIFTVFETIRISRKRVAPALLAGTTTACCVAPTIWLVDLCLRGHGGRPLNNLLIEIVVAAALWCVFAWLCSRWLVSPELKSVLSTVVRQFESRWRGL